ncbi:uncharacterized protein LOC131649022 [Vicia villosa]|uniref:uncharacterized protein LOC131649022 n=1 Tax=Vicia villosa TaxID=3911 RepID=UPI00273CA850|nr:uncharacterized protein LOC131649022 [Vicia villosa]
MANALATLSSMFKVTWPNHEPRITVRHFEEPAYCLVVEERLDQKLWFHNIKRDPQLVKKIGDATALEARATGVSYLFAPSIAVCRDPRWGRCYESYSEDHKIVQAMTEIIPGLQGDLPPNSHKGVPYVAGYKKVAACAKHFVGDGGTTKGINENNTVTTRHELLSIHMPAYYNSIIKGVSIIMGFVISDFFGLDKITSPPHANYTYSIEVGINASVDMDWIISRTPTARIRETPYAETNGDGLNLTISGNGAETIKNVCGGVNCVVVLITGRPVAMLPYVDIIGGLVTAWLPGSEGVLLMFCSVIMDLAVSFQGHGLRVLISYL